jgi:putative peptidoglycan lipid II flippase
LTVAKTAFWITVIVIASKVLAFFREIVVAALFGAGGVTDALAMADRVIGTVMVFLVVYITTTFIPSYAKVSEAEGESGALRFSNDTLWGLLVLSLLLAVAMFTAAPGIAALTAGDGQDQTSQIQTAIRIVAFKLPFIGLFHLFGGYLTARKSFYGPNTAGIALNITFIVAALVFGAASGIRGLAFASLLGIAAQALILVIWLPKEKFHLRFSKQLLSPEVRKNIVISVPALISGVLISSIYWARTLTAFYIIEGAAASLEFSYRLLTLISGLLIVPIAGMAFSYMSDFLAKNDHTAALSWMWTALRYIMFFLLPVIVIGMLFGEDIIKIVYQRGAFGEDAVRLTSESLIWHMPSLIGTASIILLLRYFYGLRDTKTPLAIAAAYVPLTILLTILFARTAGVGGIALGYSVGGMVYAILLILALRRKVGVLGLGKTIIDVCKMLPATAACGVAMFFIGLLLYNHIPMARLMAAGTAGVSVYLISMFLLKTKTAHELWAIVRKQVFKR